MERALTGLCVSNNSRLQKQGTRDNESTSSSQDEDFETVMVILGTTSCGSRDSTGGGCLHCLPDEVRALPFFPGHRV